MTGEVKLREVSESDLPVFYEHQLDPEAVAMAAFPSRDRKAFSEHWTRILADDTVLKRTILLDGDVAGYIASFERSGDLQVGYWIGRQFWGKGVASRALATFLLQVKSRPLYAFVAKHNLASMRVLEKCGFTVCGEDTTPSGPEGEQVEEFVLKLGRG